MTRKYTTCEIIRRGMGENIVFALFALILSIGIISISQSLLPAYAVDVPVSIPMGASSQSCAATNSCFDPFQAILSVGDTAIWTNNDSTSHHVKSGTPQTGSDGNFDSGVKSHGQTFSHTFNSAGIFNYYCQIHPWMIGIVTVNSCTPPDSGDWLITSSCQLSSSAIAPANVIIQNNSELIIPNGISLDIQFELNHLLVEAGSKVVIKSGGTIKNSSQLYPTTPGGMEWFSKWDNSNLRTITNGNRDPDDSMFVLTGSSDSKLVIDGDGIATISGNQPRMYVNDQTGLVKWKNTEVTIYAKRISELSADGSAGFIIGARSNHYDNNDCGVDTYYSRMQYDGSATFVKELDHPNDSDPKPTNNRIHWGGGAIPYNTWIGHKFVLRDYDGGKHVKMQMYLDKTDGQNGGNWKLVAEWNDDGNWPVPPNSCGIPVDKIILDANSSVFIRNTEISSALYKKFSVREIDPLP